MSRLSLKILNTKQFWPGLGLPSQRQMLSYQTINPCQNFYEKKKKKKKNESKCEVPPATTLQTTNNKNTFITEAQITYVTYELI